MCIRDRHNTSHKDHTCPTLAQSNHLHLDLCWCVCAWRVFTHQYRDYYCCTSEEYTAPTATKKKEKEQHTHSVYNLFWSNRAQTRIHSNTSHLSKDYTCPTLADLCWCVWLKFLQSIHQYFDYHYCTSEAYTAPTATKKQKERRRRRKKTTLTSTHTPIFLFYPSPWKILVKIKEWHSFLCPLLCWRYRSRTVRSLFTK